MTSRNGHPRTGYATVFAAAEATKEDVRPLLVNALRDLGAYPVGAPEKHVLDSDDAIETLEASFGKAPPEEIVEQLRAGRLVLWTMEGQEMVP